MTNPKSNIIKEIAQELDCGFDCYYNIKTDEIIAIPNFSKFSNEEGFKEAFGETLEKIEIHKTDYIKIEVIESFESFKIMERFVKQVTDQNFQSKMEYVLERKNPFQNFKHLLDNYNFRQKWFDFKQSELEKIVEYQLSK